MTTTDISNTAVVGRRVITNITDEDTDEMGNRRVIPVDTGGTINALSHVDADGVAFYDIAWDNGGWTVWSAAELAKDATLVTQ